MLCHFWVLSILSITNTSSYSLLSTFQIYSEFKEYDHNIHDNLNELNDKMLIAASGDCYYIDGWPTTSPANSQSSSRPVVSSTYYHNQSVDFRLNIDKMSFDMTDYDSIEQNRISSKEHLKLADQFFGVSMRYIWKKWYFSSWLGDAWTQSASLSTMALLCHASHSHYYIVELSY